MHGMAQHSMAQHDEAWQGNSSQGRLGFDRSLKQNKTAVA